ncbi:hypothetical protein ATL39_2558 [Sinobaca qinghaiensis]|uniref:Uncharacterized protein n=1 Tax=Sinobaca qinghaiensis TaxID=342944 RepID=A0A419UZQ0_9BACL|nr:hypothetical protein [Sinobaca qinghaiensis]RKD71163.1 hypothetical protein ATL39_2558 [Sinobaca qinghaiensis]
MLTFEEKIKIAEEFVELEKKEVSMGRVNFHFEESDYDKKNVVYHLHPNGNGFVYAELVSGVKTDDRGMVNIREYSAEDFRNLIKEALASLQTDESTEEEFEIEEWENIEDQLLVLMPEEDGWNVYAGLQLDGTFNTYGEAIDYLEKEGFKRVL